VNKCIIVGNLGADPEIRRTQDGRPVANLRVATSDTWRDKSTGERKERTEWHKVTVFNEGGVKFAEQYLKKGMKVYVEGQLQTRKWTDKDGVEKYSTEIVYNFNGALTSLEKVEGRQQPPDDYGTTRTRESSGENSYAAAHGKAQPEQGSYRRSTLDDDIPFEMSWR
jgi:single-strand DNA-binding protein